MTVIAMASFPSGTVYVFLNARDPGGALGGVSFSELHIQIEPLRVRTGTAEGRVTDVAQGPVPYEPCTLAKSHCESSVDKDWKFRGTDFIAFHVLSDVMSADVPSEYDIWMAARRPAGESPPVLTSARFTACTANRLTVGLRATMKTCEDCHANVETGEVPTATPLTNSVKPSSAVIRIEADTAVFPPILVYVFRNAQSSAGASGGFVSEVHIQDALVNAWRVAAGTDCRFKIEPDESSS